MRVAGVRLTPPFWRTSLNRCTDTARVAPDRQFWTARHPGLLPALLEPR
jgi:hypothetical protein